MARNDPGPEDDPLDLEDDPFTEPEPAPRGSRKARRPPPRPVRPWEAGDEPEEAIEEWPARTYSWHLPHDGRPPVYWRARDSFYFEPMVALSIVVLMFVGIYTFSQNWPPVYVVESDSMMHGRTDVVGLINAGDMVVAEKVPVSSIVPYAVGVRESVRSYGEYGDVILYHPNGVTHGTPIVHRAILFLEWVPSVAAYDAPELRGLPCGDQLNITAGQFYYSTNETGRGTGGCGTTDLHGPLELFNVGWNDSTITVDLSETAYGQHSGFLTKGDGNHLADQNPVNGGSTPSLSSLVEPGWVVGVARGMIPWFGALKLILEGNARNVTPRSWQFLGLAFVGFVLAAFGIHWALRQEGIESPIRRRVEEEEAAAHPREERSEGRSFLGGLRPWRADEEEEPDDEDRHRSRRRRPPPPPRRPDPPDAPGGRPRPRVRRSHRHPRESDDNL
jgi:signal peptidase I